MTDRLERTLAMAMAAIAVWLATSWLLAITHTLTRPHLVIALVVMAAGVTTMGLRSSSTPSSPYGPRSSCGAGRSFRRSVMTS